MKLARYLLLAAIALPTAAAAQEITFESQDYKAVSTYDSWEASPFRTGQLTGNVAVVRNHLTGEDADLGMTPNATGKVLGFQRSHLASNLYGARIDLNEPFELTKETKYVHVMIHKPTEGRVMLIGLGKRRERPVSRPRRNSSGPFLRLPSPPVRGTMPSLPSRAPAVLISTAW